MIIEYLLESKDDDPDTFMEMMNKLGGDDMSSIAQQLERRVEQLGVILGRRHTPMNTIAEVVDLTPQKVQQILDAGDAGIDLIEIDENELKG